MGRRVEKPRTVEDVIDRAKPWQLSEIVDPGHCQLVNMPESTDNSSKVCSLLKIAIFKLKTCVHCYNSNIICRLFDFYIQILVVVF